MKYKEIFKKWHFWLIAIAYPIFLSIKDYMNLPRYFYEDGSYSLVNPDPMYYIIFFISYFIARFLIVVIVYSIAWFFLWRKK